MSSAGAFGLRLLRTVLRQAARRGLPVQVRDTLALQRELLRREQAPAPLTPPAGQRIAVLAPHPDDEVFGCGGTLALAASRGCEVRVVFVSDGRKGYDRQRYADASPPQVEQRETELAARRQDEARAAGKLLGLGKPVFLGLPDSAVAACADGAPKLARALRELAPQIVLLPYLCDPHPDHWATVRLFLQAAAAAGLPASLPCWGYEVWTPLVANGFVDITAQMPAKRAAMAAHASQLGTVDYPRVVEGLNAYRSLAAGYSQGWAEAFFVDTVSEWAALFRRTWPRGHLLRLS